MPVKIRNFKQLCCNYKGFQSRISKKRKSRLGLIISSSLVDSFEIGVKFHILCWKSNGRGRKYIILQVENRTLSPTHIKITTAYCVVPGGSFKKMNFLNKNAQLIYMMHLCLLYKFLIFN